MSYLTQESIQKRVKVTMLVGLPASGKSSYIKNKHGVIISSDEYRKKLYNDVNNQTNNTELFKKMFDDCVVALKNNSDVFYDACNINYKRRRQFVSEIKRLVPNAICECLLVVTPYENCLYNNSNRPRSVPENIILKMYLNFTVPTYQEGWDKIGCIMSQDYIKNYKPLDFNYFMTFNQDNSHHLLTLGEHLIEAHNHCCKLTSDKIIRRAALLHDIGKPFTKSFTNFNGEITTEAHYRNHQNVGAYDSLMHSYHYFGNTGDILRVSALIQWHMQPYFIETEKAKKKFLNIVGEKMYNDIMLIHECDRAAH